MRTIPSPAALKIWSAVVTGALTGLMGIVGTGDEASAHGCSGRHVHPGAGLRKAVARAGPRTTFCIAAGHYWLGRRAIHPKSDDLFIGAGPHATFIRGHGHWVFNADETDGVTFRGLNISGARGTKSDAGTTKRYGRGIWGGTNMTVVHTRLRDNDQTGIGGSGPGLVLIRVEIDHNGSDSYVGCCSGGIKSANRFTIKHSFVHHNTGNGVWCDSGCLGGFRAVGNRITRNSLGGIRYENSMTHALIRGNVVRGNNGSGRRARGGIIINSAQDVVISSNTLGKNRFAGVVVGGDRIPPKNVTVVGNRMNGDPILDCSMPEVTCSGNR